ncbi:MAG TPA: response regulator [Thermoanaerobaculia bacterium]
MTTQTSHHPILIVEDDEPTRHLLRAILRRSGYASDVACNGREAMLMLQEKRYAAVVLDMMMPEVDGRAVVSFLADTGMAVPVVVCSAAGPSALADFDFDIVKAIVRKPFDIDQLVAVVTSVAGEDAAE